MYSLELPHRFDSKEYTTYFHFMEDGKDIEDIQMFGVNMTFISSSEVKNCIFHEYIFFTSRDEIKVIFTTNI